MKVLIQLLPVVNGKRTEGRKAWIGKDREKLVITPIYGTKETASLLNSLDLKELLLYESKGLLKIIEIYKR